MQGLYLGLDTANLYRLSSAVGDMEVQPRLMTMIGSRLGVQPFIVYILLILIFYSGVRRSPINLFISPEARDDKGIDSFSAYVSF
jgi:hypothetical protein